MEPTHVRLTIPDSIDPTELMGPADALLRRVEGAFDAMVAVRGNHISLAGDPAEVELATSVFSRMIRLVEAGDGLTTDDVDLLIDRNPADMLYHIFLVPTVRYAAPECHAKMPVRCV